MIAEKKPWKTPQLRILVRSRTEEAVLAACKYGGRRGPQDAGGSCRKKNLNPCDMPANS